MVRVRLCEVVGVGQVAEPSVRDPGHTREANTRARTSLPVESDGGRRLERKREQRRVADSDHLRLDPYAPRAVDPVGRGPVPNIETRTGDPLARLGEGKTSSHFPHTAVDLEEPRELVERYTEEVRDLRPPGLELFPRGFLRTVPKKNRKLYRPRPRSDGEVVPSRLSVR